MCEYCGCQDVPAIAELTAEHERLRDLGSDLAAAARRGDVSQARALVAAMNAVLQPHTAVEETGLFPALWGEYPDAMLALTNEHREIHDALASVVEEPPPLSWPRRVQEGLDRLFEHILKEQDGVFPAALATLTVDDWTAVSNARAAVSAPLGADG